MMSIRPLLALALALAACAENPQPVVVAPQPVAPLAVGTGDVAHPAPKAKSDGTDPLDDAKAIEGDPVGQRAPGFKSKTTGGKEISPYKEHVTVIHFWATWCMPCTKSMPELQKLYAKKHDDGVDIIALSVDDEEQGVAQFADNLNVKYPVVYDGGHTIANKYQPMSMPSTYVIDRKGMIRFVHAGYHDGEVETLTKEVEGLL